MFLGQLKLQLKGIAKFVFTMKMKLYGVVMEFFLELHISFLTFVMVYDEFNNVCDTGSDMILSLLKTPEKHWRGFVKLSMTKRMNLGKNIENQQSTSHNKLQWQHCILRYHFGTCSHSTVWEAYIHFRPTAVIETIFITTWYWKTEHTHCSSNLIPPASHQKNSIFSAHGVNVSLVYWGVVERQCKRSKCRFLKFSMYSTY